jgi:hypothetical protein
LRLGRNEHGSRNPLGLVGHGLDSLLERPVSTCVCPPRSGQ